MPTSRHDKQHAGIDRQAGRKGSSRETGRETDRLSNSSLANWVWWVL